MSQYLFMFFKKSQNGKNKNQKYKKSTLNAKQEREKLHIQQYIYTMAVRADTLINNYL